jgi:hypothetical protein
VLYWVPVLIWMPRAMSIVKASKQKILEPDCRFILRPLNNLKSNSVLFLNNGATTKDAYC